MIKIFELRKNPELKFILNELDFEVIDKSELKNAGLFSYNNLNNVEFVKEKTNWYVTLLSYVVELFIHGGGKFYKDKAQLKLELTNKSISIDLFKSDLKKATEVSEVLKKRIK